MLYPDGTCQMPNCGQGNVIGSAICLSYNGRILDTIFEYCPIHKPEEIKTQIKKIIEEFKNDETKGVKIKPA